MQKTSWKMSAAGLLLVLGLLPVGLHAQKIKLTVVQDNAVVLVRAEAGSDVIQEMPLGATLEAERKVGEWYEVTVTSRLGVTLTGYIHADFIRVLQAPEPEARREQETPSQRSSAPPREKKGDLAIGLGYVSASLMNDSSSYSANWSEGALVSVSQRGEILHKLDKKPYGLGISFSYLLAGGLGIQFRLDYNVSSQLEAVEGGSTYQMTWSWEDGRGPFDLDDAWDVSGEVSVFPVSLNLIYKLQSGGMLAPYFSGGMSYFMGNAKASSVRGVGITWEADGSRFLDYLSIPLGIDESLNHLGFNLGAGLDILFSPGFGVNVDAAYFLGRSSDLTWQHTAGEYAGTYFPENRWTLDQDFVQLLDGQVSALDVNTSFFKIQAGIKILF